MASAEAGRPKLFKKLVSLLGELDSFVESKIREIENEGKVSPVDILKFLKEFRKKYRRVRNEINDLRSRYLNLLKTKKELKNRVKNLQEMLQKIREDTSKFNIQLENNVKIPQKEFERRFWYVFKIIISYDQLRLKTQNLGLNEHSIDYFLAYFNKNIKDLKDRFGIDTKVLEEIRDTLINEKLNNKRIMELNDKLREFLLKFLLRY